MRSFFFFSSHVRQVMCPCHNKVWGRHLSHNSMNTQSSRLWTTAGSSWVFFMKQEKGWWILRENFLCAWLWCFICFISFIDYKTKSTRYSITRKDLHEKKKGLQSSRCMHWEPQGGREKKQEAPLRWKSTLRGGAVTVTEPFPKHSFSCRLWQLLPQALLIPV